MVNLPDGWESLHERGTEYTQGQHPDIVDHQSIGMIMQDVSKCK